MSLDLNGDIPIEFNGQVLTADAVVITPEIFVKASDLEVDPTPEIPLPPPQTDGKVGDPASVMLLLHADTPSWVDSSTYNHALTAVGAPVYDAVRKAFGTGSLRLEEPVTDVDSGNKILSGISAVISSSDQLEIMDLEDDSFTFEARIRLGTLPAYKEYTLFTYESQLLNFFSSYLTLDEDGGDTLTIRWLAPNPLWLPGADENPPEDPEYQPRYFENQMVIALTPGSFDSAVSEFTQLAFVYDKVRGYFSVYLGGVRIGFEDATQLTNPSWGGLDVLTPLETEVMTLSVGLPPHSSAPELVNDAAQFVGHLDEVRLTIGESLYQSNSASAAVYNFAWPNPIIYQQVFDEG